MPKYHVDFYVSPSGNVPVQKYLQGLEAKARAKCFYYVQLLAERGLALDRQYLAKLEPDLWELRPEWQGTEYRLLFTVHANTFWVVHAVSKKGDKLPQRVLKTARQRTKEIQGQQ